MLTKLCPRCKRLIAYEGDYCIACRPIVMAEIEARKEKAKKKYDKKYDAKRNPEYVKFYHSSEWKAVKHLKLANVYGLCEECEKKGIVKPAVEVHHIIHLNTPEGWARRLDYTNLMALCNDCHNKMHYKPFIKKVKNYD